jgi:hypothetical protein
MNNNTGDYNTNVVGNVNIINETTPENVEKSQASATVARLIKKFYQVYNEHGINLEQIPGFIGKEFDFTFGDLEEEKMRLKLSNEIIDWTCNKFGLDRRWFDNQSDRMYQDIQVYKRSWEMIDFISNLVDEVGLYKHESDIHLHAIRDFELMEADQSSEEGRVLFVFEVKVGAVSSGLVSKYIFIRDDFIWSYRKSRHEAKRLITITRAFRINIWGYDLKPEEIRLLANGKVFPQKFLHRYRRSTWDPEDYIGFSDLITESERNDNQSLRSDIREIRERVYEVMEKKKQRIIDGVQN